MMFWKRMQQATGWPLGPFSSLLTVTVAPFALWAAMYAYVWLVAAAGSLICRFWGIGCL